MPAIHQDTLAVSRLKPVVRSVVAGYLAVALVGAAQLAMLIHSESDQESQEYAVAENIGSMAADRLLP